MSNLVERVEHNIVSRHLLMPGEKLLVAVSGGLDSAVLLSLLHRLAPRHGWRLVVAHFNHQLRAASSETDERFVRGICRQLHLAIKFDRADVKAVAGRAKISSEMAARRLRHEFLARAARQHELGTVALAHQANDQVELFFLRLFRGAGGEGLSGMKWSGSSPVDPKIRLVRPLLDIPRSDLETFAQAEKIAFREDATNFQTEFERNRIRHDLLPNIRQSFPWEVDKRILRTMEIVGAESEFTGDWARTWLNGKSRIQGQFDRIHRALQRRVLQVQLLELGLAPEFELIERLRLDEGKPMTVGPERRIWRDTDGLIHETDGTEAPMFNLREVSFELSGGSGRVSFDGCDICWKVHPRSSRGKKPSRRWPGLEYFDAEQVGRVVHVRHWRPGDRFLPIGMLEAVKLQDWFVNQKVPRGRRRELILAGMGSGELFWVEGLRIGEHFKVTNKTRHLLEWRWSRD